MNVGPAYMEVGSRFTYMYVCIWQVEEFKRQLDSVEIREKPNVAEMDKGTVTLDHVTPRVTQEDKAEYQQNLQVRTWWI